ncbi:condensin-2 complex subunit G2 isoform X2 [Festucalex cinctus]
MSKREAFIEAACKENVDDFLQFVQLHKERTDPFDIEEVMEEMSRDQREALWGKLASLLRDFLLEVPPERWEEDMETDSAVDAKRVKAIVAGVTLVATVSLNVLQDGDTYNGLLIITRQLHDVLVVLPVTETHVLFHIHVLCEAWWKKNLRDKDKFGLTALVIALKKSFLSIRPITELQRVWSLHNVLSSVDYASEDGKQLAEQLVRCFQRPAFIRNDDSKRFMVFLFSWHVDFIPLIHGTIKNQLPFFNKTIMGHIAEIYYRAWKKASHNFQEAIESECIQDFMKCAILIPRSSPVLHKVLQIIFYFHKNKVYRPIEKMLSVLYKPILWKYLSVPNFEVRANATLLFTDAFPIVDPSQDIEIALQKQLDTLMVLLFDKHVCVRCNAIQGVCGILARCWEMLPTVVIVDFLKKLEELASDGSSDDVRGSVFTYLCLVLDNVLSHPVLKKMVPKFSNSLHDRSEKVRVAFVDLLLKLKAARVAKFWDVCSLEQLVGRMASDKVHVSKRVAELLFDSFFPADASGLEWCNRCVTLILMSPVAARKFYLYAHKHTSQTNIVKLMLAIRSVLNSSIPSNGDSSHLDNLAEQPKALDKDTVASLLEVVAILWTTVNKALQRNQEIQQHLYAQFGRVMSKYFGKFTDQQCQDPLMHIASFMPANAVPTFSYGVLSRLRKMEPGATPVAYGPLLVCMCSWDKLSGVLELMIEWLSEALPEQQFTLKRKVTIQEKAEAKPDLALAYLDCLLLRPSTRNKVLALSQGPLKRLYTILGNWKSLLCSGPRSSFADLALKAFTCHSRLSVHLQHDLFAGREYLQSLEDTATWVADRVLPFVTDSHQGAADGEAERSRELATQITKSFLAICGDVVLSLDDSSFNSKALHLCSLVVLSESGYLCIPDVLPVLKTLTVSYSQVHHKPADEQDAAGKCLAVVANIFQKIIELLARRLKNEPEEGRQLCQSALSGLADFLQMAQTCKLSGVFDTLFALVIVETRYTLQKMTHPEEVIIPETVNDLPPLSSILLSVILKSPPVTRAFSAEVLASLDSEAFATLTELAAVVYLLAVLRHGGPNCPAEKFNVCLKRAAIAVEQQIQAHANAECDVQRVIFRSSVTKLNEILAHWAD